MAHDVFISYSSRDKPIADAICANIEASGVRCWIAPRDIAPGEDWPTAITTAISQSRIMVLVFSASSNASEDVGREIILAANSRLVIIPFKIDNIQPEPGKQYYLARTHWLDAVNPPTQAQINALVERVGMLVPGRESRPPAEPPQGSPAKQAVSQAPRLRRVLWAGLAIALVSAVAWTTARLTARPSAQGEKTIAATAAAASPAPPTVLAASMPPQTATAKNVAPPTVAAAVTLAPTPTPPPTLMAEVPEGTPIALAWKVIVTDDFSSNRNGWPRVDDSRDGCSASTLGVQDGVLRWTIDTVDPYGCGYVYYPGISSVSDFDVALDVGRSDGAIEGSFGIGFRVTSANNHYSFVVSDTAQSYRVKLAQSGRDTALIDWTYSPAIQPVGPNRLGVSARGPMLYFFINDTLVDTVVDDRIKQGHIGVVAETYGRGLISIDYDNLSLHGIR